MREEAPSLVGKRLFSFYGVDECMTNWRPRPAALFRWHRMVRQVLHEHETALSAARHANGRCERIPTLPTEFVLRDLDLWAYQRGVMLDFCRSGKPTDNAFIEAFGKR
jgi:hypothetical protein